MAAMSIVRRLCRTLLIVLPVGLALAGCETMEKLNPFAEKETPLPGTRKPLFPEGVPGVDFGAPPPQPSNSNIPITPAITGDSPQPQGGPPPAQTQAARNAPPPPPQAAPVQAAPAAKASKSSKSGDSDDAWAGTR
jgi:hypothetical protein